MTDLPKIDNKNPSSAENQTKNGKYALDEIAAEITQDGASDPWTLADKAGKPLITPMDNKTIKNAILKRIPEARRIQLVKVGDLGKMQIVVVCQLLHETAILIEDDANVFMRHRDLMNIVDRFYNELIDRKKLKKVNKLPANFFRSNDACVLARHK